MRAQIGPPPPAVARLALLVERVASSSTTSAQRREGKVAMLAGSPVPLLRAPYACLIGSRGGASSGVARAPSQGALCLPHRLPGWCQSKLGENGSHGPPWAKIASPCLRKSASIFQIRDIRSSRSCPRFETYLDTLRRYSRPFGRSCPTTNAKPAATIRPSRMSRDGSEPDLLDETENSISVRSDPGSVLAGDGNRRGWGEAG
jgi:hypothetical protein